MPLLIWRLIITNILRGQNNLIGFHMKSFRINCFKWCVNHNCCRLIPIWTNIWTTLALTNYTVRDTPQYAADVMAYAISYAFVNYYMQLSITLRTFNIFTYEIRLSKWKFKFHISVFSHILIYRSLRLSTLYLKHYRIYTRISLYSNTIFNSMASAVQNHNIMSSGLL